MAEGDWNKTVRAGMIQSERNERETELQWIGEKTADMEDRQRGSNIQ